MNRRQAMPLIGALPLALAGCGDDANSVTRRFRVIATVEVDGQRVEGSTVMEIRYSIGGISLIGAGGGTRCFGEALILDLKGKGTIFLLPITYERGGTILHELYEFGLLNTLGIRGGVGVLNAQKLDIIRKANGRVSFKFTTSNLPTLLPITVAFRDERVPRTIFEIDLRRIVESIPGTRFVDLELEFAHAPITKLLAKRLPWTRGIGGKTAFERDPPGRGRREIDTPLSHKIVEDFFYAKESR